jgi:N-acetylglucosaminyldiphosphoundecaprenol N-acetyl-beta-D-mannosaminyltransferase
MHRAFRQGSTDETEVIRGLGISSRSLSETTGVLVEWVRKRDGTRYFACVNAHSAELAHRDATFMTALREANMLVADGVGLLVASWILGGCIRERVTGPDLFLSVSEKLARAGEYSAYYLGGSEATLERIRARHVERFPGLRIAGTYSPPYCETFADTDLAAMADRVNQATPDVLWIGLGAPKQEKWILANRDRLRVPLCGPVGAMFDYFAGNVPMPPKWVERAGLHWAHRLYSDPRRIWRRSLDIPVFVARTVADRLRGIRVTGAPPSRLP